MQKPKTRMSVHFHRILEVAAWIHVAEVGVNVSLHYEMIPQVQSLSKIT